MTVELSNFQKKRKAEQIVRQLALKDDLNKKKAELADLFDDTPIAVADTATKAEMRDLITEINLGTATNNKIARFLELSSQFGLC